MDRIQRSQQQEKAGILAWLSPMKSAFSRQSDIFSRRVNGTCEWFFENPTFKRWLDGSERALWCPGMPGAGKTVMTSAVIDYLYRTFREEGVGIGFIYCNYKDRETLAATELISILLGQLIQRHPVVPSHARKLYEQHISRGTRPTFDEYSSLLHSELATCSRAFIIVDALDECHESGWDRRSLITELQKLPQTTSLLVTSRFIPSIQAELNISCCLEIRASEMDIRTYIQHRIERQPRLTQLCKRTPTLQNDITNSALMHVQGMFLFAQLYTDSLGKKQTLKSIRQALAYPPKVLDDLYGETMQMIRSQYNEESELAGMVLTWISHARRPLTIEELRYAIAIIPDEEEFDNDNLGDEETLISVCAGLVTVDQESKIVRFFHFTAEEYFQRVRSDMFPDRDTITNTCLTYLSFDAFAHGYCSSDEEMESRLKENPFLDYAAKHWGHHAVDAREPATMSRILEFLAQRSRLSSAVQVMCLPEHQSPGYSQVPPIAVSGLWVAAGFGLTRTVQQLLEQGADVDEMTSNGETALHVAARNGHEAVVRQLLECKADVDAKDNGRRTAMHGAARNGHEAVVRQLLECKADVDAKDNGGRTAMHGAARNGHEAVVRQLLECKADVDAKDNGGWTALHGAARSGHEMVARLLMEHGADVEAKGNGRWTALHMAAGPLLLIRSADSRAEANIALHRAAGNGNAGVVRTLLDMGADPMVRDSYGYTALHCAAANGHEVVVKILLQRGVDPATGDWYGQTALHSAAKNGHMAILELLRMNNVDTTAKDCSKKLELHLSSINQDEANF